MQPGPTHEISACMKKPGQHPGPGIGGEGHISTGFRTLLHAPSRGGASHSALWNPRGRPMAVEILARPEHVHVFGVIGAGAAVGGQCYLLMLESGAVMGLLQHAAHAMPVVRCCPRVFVTGSPLGGLAVL
jgi:hypothetical protein